MRDFSKANQLIISQRETAGDALATAHRLQHYCYFANSFMAQAADDAFRKAGFDTVLMKGTMKSQVMVMHWSRLVEPELNGSCDDIALIVEHYGGEYAGWDSPFIAA